MWEPLIGSLGTLVGVIVTYLTFVRGRDKEISQEAADKANTNAQLGHISQGVDNIKRTLGANAAEMSEMNARLIRVDESTKSAHKRIDNIVRKEELK